MPQNSHLEETLVFPVAEPPNGASEQEYITHNPPVGPAHGEDNSKEPSTPDIFSDTGGTMQDFTLVSKQVARFLKYG